MAPCALGGQAAPAKPGPRPLVGAIRWDAWHGDLGAPGRAVQKSLGPAKYHLRLPWFAEVKADGSVAIRCDAPGILEQELAYAARAGLDHWAFVTYPESGPLSIPLKQYLGRDPKDGLRFCNIVEWARFGGAGTYRPMIDRLVRYFRDPRYVRVLGSRPLLYFLAHDSQQVKRQWGSEAGFKTVVDALRESAKRTGLGSPYLVVMQFSARRGDQIRRAIGADALSAYAVPGGSKTGEPFAASQRKTREMWQRMAALAPTVPNVSWGWDPRPRVDNPVPWHKPGPEHYETFTPAQCARALEEALDWAATHPRQAPANVVIAYAWNEHDEGGWLCPTRGADGRPDTRRIEAVGDMLRAWRPPTQ
ncbi:glycoside hydrolase family 99-like domain-containing protein [Planctomycetota bacterium]